MAGRILVVCYSRGGTTLRVAAQLAEALGADLERIGEPGSRAGLLGFARSAFEALARGVPTIETRRDPREYDLVVLGTPVWAHTMAAPVRTYILSHPGQLRRAAFFAVMRGHGGEQTLRELLAACEAPDAARCLFREGEIQRGQHHPVLEAFARTLRARLPSAPTWPNATA
jgi:flavodoxin